MRFVCENCQAQYMISDDKVGAKGAKVRCKKCGHVILVRPNVGNPSAQPEAVPPPQTLQVAGRPAEAAVEGASAEAGLGVEASPRGKPPSGAQILSGVDDEEIGAVFDQALNELEVVPAPATNGASGPSHALQELASEAVVDSLPTEPSLLERPPPAAPPPSVAGQVPAREEPEAEDWYVAINDKQVGPIGLDRIKAFWDSGEIGPDTLCWRAGIEDWLPLSDLKPLSSLLAPRPAKPVVIAPTSRIAAAAPAPVESVLNAPSRSAPTPGATAAPPSAPEAENAAWRPSAASTLASLMKEEIETLSQGSGPPRSPPPAAAGPDPSGGVDRRSLVDVPSGPVSIPVPVAPGIGVPQYARPRTPRRGLIIGLSAAFGVLVTAVAVMAFVLLRPAPQPPIAKPPAVAAVEPTRPPVQTRPPVAPKSEGAAEQPVARVESPKEAAKPVSPPLPPNPATVAEPGSSDRSSESAEVRRERGFRRRSKLASRDETARTPPPAAEPREAPPRQEPARSSSEDDFERVFGEKSGRAPPSKQEAKREASVYVPPPPGAADVQESLGQSDVMQVVVSNKPAILNCVAEQKRRDASVSGRIVMRWIIHPNGKVSNVSCQSEEFKKTYAADCIANLIKTWSFPRHKVQGEPINFPFTF